MQAQWCDRIESFLGIPKDEIGLIGARKKTIGDRITIALIQSLYKCADEIKDHVGFLIVDEAHRAPSRTFSEAVAAFDSRFQLGLSATCFRRDGLSRLIFWYLGDVIHEIEKSDLLKSGDILPVGVVTRQTEFRTTFDPSTEYSKMLLELTLNMERNELIVQDVARETRKGKGV